MEGGIWRELTNMGGFMTMWNGGAGVGAGSGSTPAPSVRRSVQGRLGGDGGGGT